MVRPLPRYVCSVRRGELSIASITSSTPCAIPPFTRFYSAPRCFRGRPTGPCPAFCGFRVVLATIAAAPLQYVPIDGRPCIFKCTGGMRSVLPLYSRTGHRTTIVSVRVAGRRRNASRRRHRIWIALHLRTHRIAGSTRRPLLRPLQKRRNLRVMGHIFVGISMR